MNKRILISGGGIAGLTAARFLHDQGHEIIVVDKAKAFTQAGFLISLKSFGVQIMEELHLATQLLQEATPSEFMDFVDARADLIRRVSYQQINKNTEQSITITRGGLHHVLYEAIKDQVSILFDTTIEQVHQDGQSVSVTLYNRQVIQADLLIVSEGLRSISRQKYFQDSQLEDFNVFYMGGRLAAKHPYTVGNFKTFIDVNKMLSIYPISREEVAIQCYIYSTDEVAQLQANAHQLLKENFKDYPTEVQELITGLLSSGQVYADKMGMVQAPHLAKGRMVLVGDAGYCPTALSGMGASLSIYGAKALAHFIAQSPDDISLALTNYSALMQPLVAKFQGNARQNAESFLPKDEASLELFKSSFRTASEAAIGKRLTDQLVLTDEQLHFRL